jgi:hypothetical protein
MRRSMVTLAGLVPRNMCMASFACLELLPHQPAADAAAHDLPVAHAVTLADGALRSMYRCMALVRGALMRSGVAVRPHAAMRSVVAVSSALTARCRVVPRHMMPAAVEFSRRGWNEGRRKLGLARGRSRLRRRFLAGRALGRKRLAGCGLLRAGWRSQDHECGKSKRKTVHAVPSSRHLRACPIGGG